ncbi:DUF1540 domain-containing protein [Bogoriella caseilytica]|uniref:Uncharacterized protein DUF1540 n=1 Tax=Bogoriella caseilytica TaxID=56055 RepID=A0A3N2BC79_9MICO|nr:DUF1540 domain-containing protein [Bogoriella caseilytica]ROR72802.1 uncharacterized protein DUF1540 [Bogoriella caseilytica]
MTTLAELPTVTECSAAGCSYNEHTHCKAPAVTIGGEAGSDAKCETFIPLGMKGGLDKVVTHVGACQRHECSFNENLSCSAPAVRVGAGGDEADCLTYTPR